MFWNKKQVCNFERNQYFVTHSPDSIVMPEPLPPADSEPTTFDKVPFDLKLRILQQAAEDHRQKLYSKRELRFKFNGIIDNDEWYMLWDIVDNYIRLGRNRLRSVNAEERAQIEQEQASLKQQVVPKLRDLLTSVFISDNDDIVNIKNWTWTDIEFSQIMLWKRGIDTGNEILAKSADGQHHIKLDFLDNLDEERGLGSRVMIWYFGPQRFNITESLKEFSGRIVPMSYYERRMRNWQDQGLYESKILFDNWQRLQR